MTDISFAASPIQVLVSLGVTLNNVTSTRQNVNSDTGLLIMATGSDGKAYSRLIAINKFHFHYLPVH